ncbi:hypothetical protein [Oceaniglobus trochenteri]|uniref:hypothetical protein n=1 Tax=Oceaniglobus trochenteri TaxID=2763260 RepID=UPI001CFF584D|nr:hypothetical protein [Oceaniglobus trochenteri]
MMDWTSIIAEIGGGLPAVVIVALAWRDWINTKRIDAANEARLNDMRENSRELRAVSDNAAAAINGATATISELTRLLEDRRNV